MTLRLLKIEAEDTWAVEAEPARPAPATAPRSPLRADPQTSSEPASEGVTARGLGALRRHGLLTGDGAAPAPAADRGRAIEKAREFVDQAYAVPEGGWVEGGGLWTTDRLGRRR